MLGWLRRTWQSTVHRMVNESLLQQEADVFRLYLCSKYFENGGSIESELESQDIPSYEAQKDFVIQSTQTQVCLYVY